MTKGDQGRFLLLYGSQTGQAKAIAEEIYETSPQHGLDPEMHCFSMTDKKFCIDNEKCVVIVVSTTGEGEPPDTATKFWRRIKKKTLPSDHLSQVGFTLLGLGDSNYTNFCCNGKNFDKRLQELGACHFYPPGFADDATGLEIVAEPWMERLYPALCKHLGFEGDSGSQTDNSTVQDNDTSDSKQSVEWINDLNSSKLKSLNVLDEDIKTESSPLDVSLSSGAKIMGTPQVLTPVTRTANENEDFKLEPESSKERRTVEQDSSNMETQTITKAEKQSTRKETEDVNTSASKTSGVVSDEVNNHQVKNGVQVSSVAKMSDSVGQNRTVERSQSNNDTSEQETSTLSADNPSLRRSVPPLCESGLTLPILPPPFLGVEFHADQSVKTEELPLQGGAPMPSSSSSVTMATLSSATRLTRHDAIKIALDIALDITGSEIHYQPGDSFSIVCPNNDQEVNDLIYRLGLQEKADCPLSISVMKGTKKRRAAVPEYIPQPLCTLRHALQHCCDIRNPPKKAFLRVLVEHTEEESEKRRLQELCSKQGAVDYGAFVRDPHLSLLDVLTTFPSCHPPLSRVLEHLTRLQPRPYSISSSPLVDPCKLHFVFNVVVFSESQGRSKQREGVCTGWLSHMTQTSEENTDNSLAGEISKLSIHSAPKIPIFERCNQHFHLPDDPATPIIMIGPGTGVAPFIGFLDHRACLLKTGVSLGLAWLFFGCRHKERDFLYREALEGHLSSGVLTKLSLSFSRDPVPSETSHETITPEVPRYVQDNLRGHAKEVCRLILEDKAVIYVCGDARHMAKNVTDTLSSIFIQETGRNAYEAVVLLATLREEKRYIQDVWT